MSNRLSLLTFTGDPVEFQVETIVGIYPNVEGSIIAVEVGDDLAEHEVAESAHEVSRRWGEARGFAQATA
ncbi:MAG: hypothetical protein M3552_18445 [Planctomycetota bacterium]|nr:hypothetical protein [Planctomycetaceae bacterium]MDQ3332598.1 hypothetical protein [Planctomycetota bacterium]